MLTGWILIKYHSKYPDFFCGYHVGRTAIKSEEAWEFANKYSGRLLIIMDAALIALNFIYLALRFALPWLMGDASDMAYALFIAFAPAIMLIIVTESKLHRTFGSDGVRKN